MHTADVSLPSDEAIFDAALPFDETTADTSWTSNPNANAPGTPGVPLSRLRKRKREHNETIELLQEENGPNGLSTGQCDGVTNGMKNDSKEFKSIRWKKKSMQVHVNEVVFRAPSVTSNDMHELKTPYDCFNHFLTDEFLQQLSDQTNLYARQKNVATRFVTNPQEIRRFIGILFFMSVYRYPSVRSFWGRHAFGPISRTLTLRRFEEIRKFLHFNDDSEAITRDQPGHDKVHKLRPVIEHFNKRFGSVPMSQRLCVDEMMCSTKMGGNPTSQYMPAKPHKWGTKLFVLCDSTGFSYAFEVYSGAGDNMIPDNAPDLGAASNVVVRLSSIIPDNVNHIIYFDNFYTSLGLLTYLRSRGICSLGTVRENRVPNIKLSSNAELLRKKVQRGYSEEFVGNVFGIDIANVLWQDNKPVRLLSTYVGVKPFLSSERFRPPTKSMRFDRTTKTQVEVDCPYIIKEYNRHMGGVDLMDGLIGRYHLMDGRIGRYDG